MVCPTFITRKPSRLVFHHWPLVRFGVDTGKFVVYSLSRRLRGLECGTIVEELELDAARATCAKHARSRFDLNRRAWVARARPAMSMALAAEGEKGGKDANGNILRRCLAIQSKRKCTSQMRVCQASRVLWMEAAMEKAGRARLDRETPTQTRTIQSTGGPPGWLGLQISDCRFGQSEIGNQKSAMEMRRSTASARRAIPRPPRSSLTGRNPVTARSPRARVTPARAKRPDGRRAPPASRATPPRERHARRPRPRWNCRFRIADCRFWVQFRVASKENGNEMRGVRKG